jgi:hypothetical protein
MKSDSARLGWMCRVVCAMALSLLHLTNLGPCRRHYAVHVVKDRVFLLVTNGITSIPNFKNFS